MTSNLISELENELIKINERIRSKEVLLEKFPDDIGLKIGIIDFEDLKEEIIIELSEVKKEPILYTNYIKEKLKKTQETLFENRNLNLLNHNNEEIIEEIDYLELLERDLIEKLEYCNLKSGFAVYEMKLKGDKINGSKIPISILGKILIDTQEIPSSISKFVYSQKKELVKPVKVKHTIQSLLNGEAPETITESKDDKIDSKTKNILSEELIDNSQFLSMGMIGGSIRIFLTSPKPTLNNEMLNDSILIFKNLINCGNDKEAIMNAMAKLGDVEPILKYRNFLHTLYNNNIDVEFSGKNNEFKDVDIFKIDHKEAKKIYHTLNQKDSPITKDIIEVGTLRAVDLETRTFKFHIDSEDKIIPGSFKKELDDIMAEKTFNNIYKIKFLSSIPTTKFQKTNTIKYELLEFLD